MADGLGGQTSWYRVVSSGRQTKREVLRSGGGRFHDDPDREPTSYPADSLKTAWLEVSAHAGEARTNMRAFRAWRIVLPEGLARKIVDLRDEAQQQRHHITQVELEADPAPESGKAVARRLRREGKGGIVYRSVRNRPDGVCVVEGTEAELSMEPANDEWGQFIRREG